MLIKFTVISMMALNLDKEHNYLFDSNRPDCDKSTYLVFGDEVSGDSSMHHVSTFHGCMERIVPWWRMHRVDCTMVAYA